MELDALAVSVGAASGASLVALLWYATARWPRKQAERTHSMTAGWRLRELQNPVVVAHNVAELQVPADATIYASGSVSPAILATCTVHKVPAVRSAFALDDAAGRAIVFTGGAQDGQLALVTEDPTIVDRLRTEWQALESRKEPYVERLLVGELAGKAGVTVQTQGLVQDVLPYKDRFMMRLEDQGAIIGVLVDRDPEDLREERIMVRGLLVKQDGGYLALEADDVRRLR